MNDQPQNRLDRLIANLPKDITPPANVWPSVAAHLSHKPRHGPPLALAASIAIAAAGLAGLFTWAVIQSRSAPRVLQSMQAAASFEEPRDPKYLQARESVEKTFHDRLALLDPATRAKIEASLATIQQAHEDIRQALAADPQSPVLEQLWESTWHDEFDLYDRVVQATQPSMIRI
jgi:hypothetical protein